jgi:hypothetical protein
VAPLSLCDLSIAITAGVVVLVVMEVEKSWQGKMRMAKDKLYN